MQFNNSDHGFDGQDYAKGHAGEGWGSDSPFFVAQPAQPPQFSLPLPFSHAPRFPAFSSPDGKGAPPPGKGKAPPELALWRSPPSTSPREGGEARRDPGPGRGEARRPPECAKRVLIEVPGPDRGRVRESQSEDSTDGIGPIIDYYFYTLPVSLL